MSNQHRSDEEWFEALGGNAPHGAKDAQLKSAAWVRAQYLRQSETSTDANSQPHQREQLARLMARLEAEGHFAEAPNKQHKARKAWPTWFAVGRFKWTIAIAAPVAVALTVVGIIFQPTAQNDTQTPDAVLRGTESVQQRFVDKPQEQAAALCAQLAAFAKACRIDSDATGATLTASVRKDAASNDFLHGHELVLNASRDLVVRFEKR